MMSDANPPSANGGAGEDDLEFDQMSAAEKEALVNSLLDELRDLFHGYVAGDTAFEEVTFETFDTLQTLHALATGSLLIEYVDDDDQFEEFDELAGEPMGEADPSDDNGAQPGKHKSTRTSKGNSRGQR